MLPLAIQLAFRQGIVPHAIGTNTDCDAIARAIPPFLPAAGLVTKRESSEMWKSLGFAAAILSALAATQATAQQAGDWHVLVQPYLMIPAMNGDAAVRGIDADVDVGRNDVVKNLNIGFLGYVEASNGRWSFGVDTNYMNLDANNDDALVAANVSQTAVQPMIYYRVARYLDVMAGARYNGLKLGLESPVPLIDGVSRKKDWIDPIVGVRFQAPISKGIQAGVLANVGGFGVGSDISVQIRPMVNFSIARNITIDGGYQFIYMDYKSGSRDRRFAYDVTTDGPILGATFRF